MAPSKKTRRRQGRRLGYWAALAILIHGELAVVIGLGAYFWAPRQADLSAHVTQAGVPETIDLDTLDEETSQKILAELEKEEAKAAEAQEEQAKKEAESKDAPGQVVEMAKPDEEKRPENARFAAEYDSSVEKETKKFGKLEENARRGDRNGEDEVTRPATPPSASPKSGSTPTPPGALALKTPGQKNRPPSPGSEGEPGPTARPSGEHLEAPLDPSGALALPGGGSPREAGGAATGGVPSTPGAPSILPSQQQLSRAIGSGTQDHLKDIDDGDETALNAKRWKFASFFNRVKQQVRDHWRPGDEYRRRDPSGSIYGNKDRYTLLRVQLKPDGTLANVALETPSGVEFLDDVAIEAFRQAQPFPNPPKQLVEETSGMINFRFGFFFELSGAPKMKIFKYNSM